MTPNSSHGTSSSYEMDKLHMKSIGLSVSETRGRHDSLSNYCILRQIQFAPNSHNYRAASDTIFASYIQ